ncbi:MAG: NAD(P)/FAD-dependent oxidoreductase [Roseiflexus sp.]|jgi:NADH dehydrogenase|nr:NAD(P)/FAD-dependent oxidoreductase [Roseiflexus sp.]MBO9364008.1 NAD(P)/FAD-dependent oxidoreductase [Roseiflexus sp.]MBO9383183.1 NAD(P)/FAD-dependent oxidoreductase [Roseiflexus sp.]MBO9389510.1 NAD(P)/FAD-dependent oxidoreductase [Roseiflexus sp.]
MIDIQPDVKVRNTPVFDRTVTERRARPRVVIVGAGFGGLAAARELANADVDVLVINRTNYHGFWPLLYQVATAGLEPESIAYPVRAILRRYRNADFLLAEVNGVDFERRAVLTDVGPVMYDYLVLAAGSTTNFFGNERFERYTLGMKDLDEAQRLRNHILTCFEHAVAETDPVRRAALLTFVVVGGGPTGVELAGAFIELIRHVMRKDYPMLDVRQAHVVLVEATDRVLATFPESLQRAALDRLRRMGVDVRLNAPVADARPGALVFRDGTVLAAETIVWAAGVRASPLAEALGVALGRGARVKVEPTLTLPGHPEVFVIGDMAYLEGYRPGVPYPMVAPVAIQMGEQAARNIIARTRRNPMKPFRYFDKGQMATIGRSAAVLDAFGIQLTGWPAWVGWLFVHLMELVGFRNRALVLLNWAYSYFTYDRGVRLIFGIGAREKKLESVL